MDSSLLKDLCAPSGHDYHYLWKQPQAGRPTLLFVHGFPSSSYGWRHQAKYFGERGFGLIIPDMLGYGGTSKPTDPREYVLSSITRDLVAIMDAQAVRKAVIIGHDLGSPVVSRLVNWYPERCLGVAFIAVGYQVPAFEWKNIEAIDAVCKQYLGHEILGYWKFFRESDSGKVLREKEDSFYSLVYCEDTKLWARWLGPTGKLREWLENDRRAPEPHWLSDRERKEHRRILAKSGWQTPKCWYSVRYLGYTQEDEKDIPKNEWTIPCPALYIGAGRDPICPSAQGIRDTEQYTLPGHFTAHVFPGAGHWVPEEKPEETNRVIESFVRTLRA